MAEAGTFMDPVRTASGILVQLLSYTRQMAEYENNADINVPALSKACGQRLEDLKKVLPQALKELDCQSDIRELIKEIQVQLVSSIRVVEKAKVEASLELMDFSTKKRALRAYSSNPI